MPRRDGRRASFAFFLYNKECGRVFFSYFCTQKIKVTRKETPHMQKNLVIVESPAKAKTIEKFLGKDYKVLSSYGHIRDLPKKLRH